jgi:hypothetical protein
MTGDPSATAPYEELATAIERELALVPTRDFAAIAVVKRERGAIVKRLPRTPPPEARAALERCRRGQDQIAIELYRVRDVILRELHQVGHARRAAHGYAPAVVPRRARISASA